MKIILFRLFPCILVLLITGCTSTYVKKDFSSEEAFLGHINKNSGSAGLIMKNDSLIGINDFKIVQDSIKWETTAYKFAFDPNSRSVLNHSIPLNDVKAVTFTHHWKSNIPIGVLEGIAVGGILTTYLFQGGQETNSGYHTSDPPGFFSGIIAGFLAGGIVGIIAGEDEVYILDDSFEGSMVRYNHRNKLGIKIGRHSGFGYDLKKQDGHNSLFTTLSGNGIPGFALTMYYNYPYTRLLSVNGELSFMYEGSEAKYSIEIPTLIRDGFPEASIFSNQSKENLSILEAAPVARLNLWRSDFSPYIFLGPKFDIILNAESGIDSYLRNLTNNAKTIKVESYSQYRNFVFGTTFGAGISTGNLFPVELLLEARYNYDITPRFEMYYNMPAGGEYFNYWYRDPGNQKMLYRSSEFQLNIGAAIF